MFKLKTNIFFLQLESLEAKEQPNGSLREAIKPYMFEAGLDPDILANNTHLVAEGLMLYNVIDRCRLQLEDIKSGTLQMPSFAIFFLFGKLFAYAGKQLLSWCICQSCYLLGCC